MSKSSVSSNHQKQFDKEPQNILNNPLLNKDTWFLEKDLNVESLTHDVRRAFSFYSLSQDWLKLSTKLYVLTKIKVFTVCTIKTRLNAITAFSVFLKSKSIDSYNDIDNQVFEEFGYYLKSKKFSQHTISTYYQGIVSLFDTCYLEGWLDINTYWFKGKRRHSQINDEINYIPEEVWNQINSNLDVLPLQIQRMVLLLRTTGLRIGELLNLPLDCLRKRGEQWRLRLKETEKYQIADELPINVIELVTIIQEQQDYIKQLFGENYRNLFCSNSSNRARKNQAGDFDKAIPKIMSAEKFNKWLNFLAQEADIRSKDGTIWHFSSHQFRRTVATVMTNAGIRDLIIQKYLRHRSPDMLQSYTHILKKTLSHEYEELIKEKKYVDITGKVVENYKPTNPVIELIRRRIYQITTQYGECHRPTLKQPCPTVNACWRCKEWRVNSDDLPYLKEDLERVESELKIAENLGMVRQQQGLELDRDILNNCIRGLSEKND